MLQLSWSCRTIAMWLSHVNIWLQFRMDSFYFSRLKNVAAFLSCGWVACSFKFRRCKNMQMQQHNRVIILIQKSMALWEPRGSSYINRMANRNIKRAGGILHMLSLILLSRMLLKHRSNSVEINTVIPVHVKEESGFLCVKFFDHLSLERRAI